MLVTMAGRRWRLCYADPGRGNDGSCDPPTAHHKTIKIRRSLRRYPVALTETLIHEFLHAQGWPLDEDFVGRAAEEITRALDRLGLIKDDARPDLDHGGTDATRAK